VSAGIIFRSYNRFVYTKWALKALEQNTNWDLIDEFIACDANSEDGTKDLIEEFLAKICDKVSVMSFDILPGNVGLPLYLAAEHSKCDYLHFVDNDHFVQKNWNEFALTAIQWAKRFGINCVCHFLSDEEMVQNDKPISMGLWSLYPVQYCGGKCTVTRQFVLQDGPRGKLKDYKNQDGYMPWWAWHQYFKGQIAALRPPVMIWPLDIAKDREWQFQHREWPQTDTLLASALEECTIELREEYIKKGWMRSRQALLVRGLYGKVK